MTKSSVQQSDDGTGQPTQKLSSVRTPSSSPWAAARKILGDKFVLPKEVETGLGMTYSQEQLDCLGKTMYSDAELQWLKQQGFILLPGPPFPTGPKNFELLVSPAGGWIAMRDGVVPDSCGKTYAVQSALLSDQEIVPDARIAYYALSMFAMLRHRQLSKQHSFRTSTKSLGMGITKYLVLNPLPNANRLDPKFLDEDDALPDLGITTMFCPKNTVNGTAAD